MKLFISNVGITESVQTIIEDTKQDLNQAMNMYLYCPSTFQHASYVRDLRNKISEFSREATYINSALVKTERKYNSCFDNEISSIDNINEKKIASRKGLSGTL